MRQRHHDGGDADGDTAAGGDDEPDEPDDLLGQHRHVHGGGFGHADADGSVAGVDRRRWHLQQHRWRDVVAALGNGGDRPLPQRQPVPRRLHQHLWSATTTAATLTVNTAPVVTTNPTSTTNTCVGGNATFTVAFSGSPAPTIQWQVSTNGGGSFTNIGGATSSSLTVTAVAGLPYRQYRAVGTNVCGSATSNAATLGVDAIAPTFTSPCPNTVNVVATSTSGAIVNFSATATDNCGSPTITYSPQQPGTNFPVGTTVITATATDSAGNQATCTINVVVSLPFDRCVRQGTTGNYFKAIINPPAGSEALKGYWEFHTVVGATDTLVASGTATVVANLPTFQTLQQYGPGPGTVLNANINTGAGSRRSSSPSTARPTC